MVDLGKSQRPARRYLRRGCGPKRGKSRRVRDPQKCNVPPRLNDLAKVKHWFHLAVLTLTRKTVSARIKGVLEIEVPAVRVPLMPRDILRGCEMSPLLRVSRSLADPYFVPDLRPGAALCAERGNLGDIHDHPRSPKSSAFRACVS
jgi:hypothetical protein